MSKIKVVFYHDKIEHAEELEVFHVHTHPSIKYHSNCWEICVAVPSTTSDPKTVKHKENKDDN
jgi:hypothetical protein